MFPSSLHRSPTAAVLAAALVLTLLAPSGAEAKKKKKKKEHSVLSGLVVGQAEEPLAGVAVTVNAAGGAEFTGSAKTDKAAFAAEVEMGLPPSVEATQT